MPRKITSALPTMRWFAAAIFSVCILSYASSGDAKKYTIKTADTPAPKEVSEAIRKLLADGSVQVLDGDEPICDVWFRKDLPAEATPEQIKTGVTYREVKPSEILGVIQLHRDWADYRKQKLKVGVYTMRLGHQPENGKHTVEVSEFRECAVLIAAKADTKTGLLETKAMVEASRESHETQHPGVFMLWPNHKPAKEPAFTARPKNHWVLYSKCNLVVAGKATGTSFGIGLNLVGHSPAE